MTEKQLNMLKHAWGFDSKDPGYRTHFCTSLEDPDMLALVKAGYFMEPVGLGSVGKGYGIFHVSDKGEEYLKGLTK